MNYERISICEMERNELKRDFMCVPAARSGHAQWHSGRGCSSAFSLFIYLFRFDAEHSFRIFFFPLLFIIQNREMSDRIVRNSFFSGIRWPFNRLNRQWHWWVRFRFASSCRVFRVSLVFGRCIHSHAWCLWHIRAPWAVSVRARVRQKRVEIDAHSIRAYWANTMQSNDRHKQKWLQVRKMSPLVIIIVEQRTPVAALFLFCFIYCFISVFFFVLSKPSALGC